MKPPFRIVRPVDQLERPECIEAAGEMPLLDPRPMPQLPARADATCNRKPLWRLYEKLGS